MKTKNKTACWQMGRDSPARAFDEGLNLNLLIGKAAQNQYRYIYWLAVPTRSAGQNLGVKQEGSGAVPENTDIIMRIDGTVRRQGKTRE
ncbi:MAG: hypothetical protein V4671_03695 [Armatimonadota bacterium]